MTSHPGPVRGVISLACALLLVIIVTGYSGGGWQPDSTDDTPRVVLAEMQPK